MPVAANIVSISLVFKRNRRGWRSAATLPYNGTMPRLFVALRPPPVIRLRMGATMAGVANARWQDDEQLHLTLRFIGEVERLQAEDIAAALGSIHADAPSASLSGMGRFGRRGRTDTLWAGIAPQEPLAHLHRKVDRACVRAGVAPDTRAYLPHVTLARLPRSAEAEREIERWLADHAALASEAFTMQHLVLYESRLARTGASYEPVARWPLGTTASAPGSTR